MALPPNPLVALAPPGALGAAFSGHSMTAIERTAYPCAGRRPDRAELRAHYDLAEAEHAFLRRHARGDAGRLMLALVLETRAHLGFFRGGKRVTRGHGRNQEQLDPPTPIREGC